MSEEYTFNDTYFYYMKYIEFYIDNNIWLS